MPLPSALDKAGSYLSKATNAGDITSSPKFEIYLLKSKLSFINPKQSAPVISIWSGKKRKATDLRPFVDTLGKRKYFRDDDSSDVESLDICQILIYENAWSFKPDGCFKKPCANLYMTVRAVGVIGKHKERFPDLLDPTTFISWTEDRFHHFKDITNQITLIPRNDSIEVVFNDKNHALSSRTPASTETQVLTTIVNHKPITSITPGPDQVNYYIAFTSEDAVEFNFKIEFTENITDLAKHQITRRIQARIESIIQSIQLDIVDLNSQR